MTESLQGFMYRLIQAVPDGVTEAEIRNGAKCGVIRKRERLAAFHALIKAGKLVSTMVEGRGRPRITWSAV
jgi:hypothetical protein